MRYHGRINYVKCHEWGLNIAQGALFDLLNESSSWAKTHIIGDEVYYWVSRNKVLDELPVAYKKADTVYRSLKILAEKDLIIYTKEGAKDLVKLTEKGKTWNAKINSEINPNVVKDSEINPSKLGNKSENTAKNSEINPTDKDTNYKSTSNKNTSESVSNENDGLGISFNDFWDTYGKKLDTAKCKKKWSKLTKVTQQLIMDNVVDYVAANSDKSYRKNPLTYLNGECWIDEVISNQPNTNVDAQGNDNTNQPTVNSQQPNNNDAIGYHPSHDDIDTRPPVTGSGAGWHWNEPLPNMSISDTYKAIADKRLQGESKKNTYDRLFNQRMDLV